MTLSIAPSCITITVVLQQQPRKLHIETLTLPTPCTAQQALTASACAQALSAQALDALQLSVWGRKASAQQLLRDQDRLELCRPLQVDPKHARRERFAQQGARTAGLFAKRRAGAKAGY